jgi:hypothetical protein
LAFARFRRKIQLILVRAPRPQDRNLYVLAWFASIFILALYVAYWVFLRDGAKKVVLLQPFEIK